jgi:hypothetical protein
MPDPIIHSSSWTGPLNESLRTPKARLRTPWEPSGARLGEWTKPWSPAERRWIRLVVLVFLSPVLLFVAWELVHAATGDTLWIGHCEWLILWSLAVVAIGILECRAGRPASPNLRSSFLCLALAATFAFACWYSYATLMSHSDAITSKKERTYEVSQTDCSKCTPYYVHQRADGTTVEGQSIGPPLPYWPSCVEVQRLTGDYGFEWIRVVDRSPPAEHEVRWPIRREDCFSTKPLASLRD